MSNTLTYLIIFSNLRIFVRINSFLLAFVILFSNIIKGFLKVIKIYFISYLRRYLKKFK